MALVELILSPLTAHVRTARLVVVAVARRAGLDDEHVDELRFAIGEACARAVGLHAVHAPAEPVVLTVDDVRGWLVVTVADRGPAAGPIPADLTQGLLGLELVTDGPETIDPDVALTVLSGLVDDLEVTGSAAGTTVTMRWPLSSDAAAGWAPLSA